eukprot:TRINITY_DN66312_c0_g1_i1.p1 TRINITY_DN66312_c0_g1~~TRINITY_DN66312_c0_g1_i1.p1  ORF type:complete len:930 (+),score=145.29 TRINITY_DN66312_c0_g1_i1:131-2920(+)
MAKVPTLLGSYFTRNSSKDYQQLLEHTSEVLSRSSSRLTETDQASCSGPTKIKKLSYGKCLHPGAADLGYTHQAYAWIEQGNLSDESQVGQILQQWGLKAPDLVIRLESSGDKHPLCLVEEHMLKMKELNAAKKDAEAAINLLSTEDSDDELSVCRRRTRYDNEAAPDANTNQNVRTVNSKLVQLLGATLLDKLVTTTVALLDACASTNCWIAVAGDAHTFSYVLELALQQTHSRPVILCFVDRGQYCHDNDYQDCWEELKENSFDTSEEDANMQRRAPVQLPEYLFDRNLSRCWKEHSAASEHKWGKWPFRAASHYIFASSEHAVPLAWLGAVGTVCLHGGAEQEDMIYSALKRGRLLVLLKNSGGCADFWSYLLETVKKKTTRSRTVSGVVEALKQKYAPWYDHDGNLYGIPRLQDKLHTYVSGLVEMNCLNHERLKSAVVINVWQDSPEETLVELSKLLAHKDGAPDGGDSAEQDAIMTVTEHHAVLDYNAQAFSKKANFLVMLGFLMSFCSTLLAVSMTYAETLSEEWVTNLRSSKAWTCTNVLLLILPTLSGLLVSVSSRLQLLAKWGAVYVAAAQLESEIYHYRAKTGVYDVDRIVLQTPADSKQKETKPPSKASRSRGAQLAAIRGKFMSQTSALFGRTLTSELREDALARPLCMDEMLNDKRDLSKARSHCRENLSHKKTEKQSSGQHTSRTLMAANTYPPPTEHEDAAGFSLFCCPSRAEESHSGTHYEHEGEQDLEAAVPSRHKVHRDLVCYLTADMYLDQRLVPTLEHLESDAPRLSNRLQIYEISIFMVSLIASLLGSFGWKDWMPVAVGLGSSLVGLLNFEALSARLRATNAGIRDLRTTLSTYRSMGIVERRMPSVKQNLVDVTEAVIMKVATAHVAGLAQASGTTQASAEHDAESDNKSVNKKESKDQDESEKK